jgi:SOS response associated peptidase (SRAP)
VSLWSKPLKELKPATFNARAETFADRPFFRQAFKHNRRLIPVSGYYQGQDTPSGIRTMWGVGGCAVVFGTCVLIEHPQAQPGYVPPPTPLPPPDGYMGTIKSNK